MVQNGRPHRLRTLVGAAALAAVLSLATSLAACLQASADTQLPAPVISQQNGAWAGNQLGLSADTIGSSGCAITAVAMLLQYYGAATDPAALNAWLTQNNGYWADEDVLWDAVTAYTGGKVTFSGWYGPDLQLIAGEIYAGRPVVAEVVLNGNQHFVLITGAGGGGLRINDPWFGDNVNFSDRYGDPSTGIVSIRTFLPAPSQPAAAPPAAGDQTDQGDPASGGRMLRRAQ